MAGNGLPAAFAGRCAPSHAGCRPRQGPSRQRPAGYFQTIDEAEKRPGATTRRVGIHRLSAGAAIIKFWCRR